MIISYYYYKLYITSATFRRNGHDPQPDFSFFIFQTLQGITGLLLILIMSIIYVFASQGDELIVGRNRED